MSPKKYMMGVAIWLFASITLEITLLAGVLTVSDTVYHHIHLAFMLALVLSQFALFLYGQSRGIAHHRLALWFALGAAVTCIGDYINSGNSPVQPISLKLTWALLFFGTGYSLYSFALWQYNNKLLKNKSNFFARYRYAIALLIIGFNVQSWFDHAEPYIKNFEWLYYGSFVFNATIYVVLPMSAIWYFYNSRYSVGGLIVLLGAIWIPYSDLILFESWLRGGDAPAPSTQLYAYNWIVYYGGQILLSVFPAVVMHQHSIIRQKKLN